ncbi:MAG: hypothetical protein JXR31_03155 [Prolixibacteraceae bacterium]|nr:hypothetical protein [Prolixibacteraceae bacterium]MBN2773221.1 hypothetical protein [Prolixibacteraceae bacterium]
MKYFSLFLVILIACTSDRNIPVQYENIELKGLDSDHPLEIDFQKGKYFNHPCIVFWTEDLEGNYLETLYVTRFVGTGKFGHGELSPGKWDNKPGEARRPATLPYWAHKRGIKAPDGLYIPSHETPVPDALTSATPLGNFRLETGFKNQPEGKFRLLMEINQPWDSNQFWSNSKFPDNKDYFTSLQPALVYSVTIDPDNPEEEYFLNPIGHSHPSGENGKLFTDLTTLTTAKEIAEKIIIRLK